MKVKITKSFVVGTGKPDAIAGEVRELDDDLARFALATGKAEPVKAEPADEDDLKSKKGK